MRMKPLGRLVLIAAVGVAVGAAGQRFLRHPSRTARKTIQWEMLEGNAGSDLNRSRTPNGWIVESPDGYLLNVVDPEHKWLADEEENN